MKLRNLPEATWQCTSTSIAPGQCDPYLPWKEMGSPEQLTVEQRTALLSASQLPQPQPMPLDGDTLRLRVPGFSLVQIELVGDGAILSARWIGQESARRTWLRHAERGCRSLMMAGTSWPIDCDLVTHYSRGGVSPEEVTRMIADRREGLAGARERHLRRIETLENAQGSLLGDLRALAEA